MTLEEYLIKTRKERGYSQRDLAEKSNVSPAEISRVESGKRQKPAPAVLQALAEALDVNYGKLLELAGYVPKKAPKSKKPLGSLITPDGKHRDLYECAEEMYEKDKDWLQTAYLASSIMNEKKLEQTKEILNALLELHRLSVKKAKATGDK